MACTSWNRVGLPFLDHVPPRGMDSSVKGKVTGELFQEKKNKKSHTAAVSTPAENTGKGKASAFVAQGAEPSNKENSGSARGCIRAATKTTAASS